MYGLPQFAARGGTYFLGAPFSQRPAMRRAAKTRVRRLSYLGDVPADSSFVSVVTPTLETTGKFASRDAQMIAQGLATLQLPFDISGYPDCQGMTIGAGTANGLTAASAVAAKLAASTGPAAPFVLAGAGILSLVSAIFGHHAQAVKVEQQDSCAAIPAANEALTAIATAYQHGQINATQAAAALDQVGQQFMATVRSSYQTGPPCNWNCQIYRVLQAIIAKSKAIYADDDAKAAAAVAANPVAGAVNPVIPGSGPAISSVISSAQQAIASAKLPSWVLPAAAFAVLWELL